MKNGWLIVTSCAGRSSQSPSSEPMMNDPGSIRTIFMPSELVNESSPRLWDWTAAMQDC